MVGLGISQRPGQDQGPSRLKTKVVLGPAAQDPDEDRDHDDGNRDKGAVGAPAHAEGGARVLHVGELEEGEDRDRSAHAQVAHRPELRRPVDGEKR